MAKLSHLDERGVAHMVDVSAKDNSERVARAEAVVSMSSEAFAAIASHGSPKGDVLAAARIAGIMAAKKTAELIPLCHPLAITSAAIEFGLSEEERSVRIRTVVKTTGKTGVEMEALTAAAIAALTVYDMIKAVDRHAAIEHVRLTEKSGGKSGTYVAPAATRPLRGRVVSNSPAAGTNKQQRTVSVGPSGRREAGADREAFRTFMAERRLRATEWAKEAGVAPSQIYAYLTGRSRAMPADVAERLARTAHVRVEDMFR